MKMTEESTFGINWNPVQLEEGWEDECDDGEYPSTDFPTQLHPARNIQTSCIRAFGHRNQAELTHSDTDFRKVTIYLPNALLQKMRQLKKRKKIHSYSEAIAAALTPYL